MSTSDLQKSGTLKKNKYVMRRVRNRTYSLKTIFSGIEIEFYLDNFNFEKEDKSLDAYKIRVTISHQPPFLHIF